VKTETEQHIWNECSRLIANAAADIVKDISPNAWQHVHLIGAFDFEQTESQIDINALAARYDDPTFWNRALIEAPDDPLAQPWTELLPFWSVGHF
jgi:hypothetical protein